MFPFCMQPSSLSRCKAAGEMTREFVSTSGKAHCWMHPGIGQFVLIKIRAGHQSKFIGDETETVWLWMK